MKTKGNKSFERNHGDRLKTYIAKQTRRALLSPETRVKVKHALQHATGIHTHCAPWDCRVADREFSKQSKEVAPNAA